MTPTLKVTKKPAVVHTNTRAKLSVTVKATGATVNGAKLTAVSAMGKKLASGTVRNGKVLLTLPKLKLGKKHDHAQVCGDLERLSDHEQHG